MPEKGNKEENRGPGDGVDERQEREGKRDTQFSLIEYF